MRQGRARPVGRLLLRKAWQLSISLPVSAALCPAAYGDVQSRIVGGAPVESEEDFVYKHSARLLVSAAIAPGKDVPPEAVGVRPSWRCSAVIVAPNALLTAAHCLPGRRVFRGEDSSYWASLVDHDVEIFYGMSSKKDFPRGDHHESFIRHPQFRDEWYIETSNPWEPEKAVNDLAVVFLSRDLPLDKEPVALLDSRIPLEGQELVLAGFGRAIGGGDRIDYPELRKVAVPFIRQLLNRSDFFAGLGNATRPRPIGNPRGGCSGDSGGGAFLADEATQTAKLAGLIVRGPDQDSGGCEASVTILTDLRAYESWVRGALL